MDDQERIAIHTRIAALETALQLTLTMLYMSQKKSPAAVATLNKGLIDIIGRTTVPGVDPVISDHLTAEVTERIQNLLDGAVKLYTHTG